MSLELSRDLGVPRKTANIMSCIKKNSFFLFKIDFNMVRKFSYKNHTHIEKNDSNCYYYQLRVRHCTRHRCPKLINLALKAEYAY